MNRAALEGFEERGFDLERDKGGSWFEFHVNDPAGEIPVVRFVAVAVSEANVHPTEIGEPMTLSVELIGGGAIFALRFETVAAFFAAFDEGGGFL